MQMDKRLRMELCGKARRQAFASRIWLEQRHPQGPPQSSPAFSLLTASVWLSQPPCCTTPTPPPSALSRTLQGEIPPPLPEQMQRSREDTTELLNCFSFPERELLLFFPVCLHARSYTPVDCLSSTGDKFCVAHANPI